MGSDPATDPRVDGPALGRALDAFCAAYGHGLTWDGVLPLLRSASTVERGPREQRPASDFAHRFQEDGWPR